MHFFPAVLTFAAFWAILPVKLIAIAGFVYVIVAALKAKFPQISGKYALILNIAFSACGVLGFAKPEELGDPRFWAGLILTIASASGIHGTVKAATGGPEQADVNVDPNIPQSSQRGPVSYRSNGGLSPTVQNPAGVSSKNLLLLIILIGAIGISGCQHQVTAAAPPPLPAGAVDQADAAAYKTLKPANSFAASISSDIQAGRLTPSANLKLALESLNRALNVADHAAQSYHHAGGGSTAELNASVAAALEAWHSAQGALNLQGK